MKKVILFLLIGISIYGQSPDPKKIIKEVAAKFSKVKDYSVDASIKVDIPSLKMPDRKMKIYYKQPDKTHIESDGFAILPKKGLNFNPTEFLHEDFASVYLRQDKINGRKVDVINLMPKSDTAKLKLVKLWIDSDEKVIVKLETSSDRGGAIQTELTYGNDITMGLPSQIKFQLDMGGGRLPAEPGRMKKNNAEKKDTKGMVIVTYSNYRINKGIDDKIFIEKKK